MTRGGVKNWGNICDTSHLSRKILYTKNKGHLQFLYEFLFKSTLGHCDWIHLKIDCKRGNSYNCTVKYNENLSWKCQELPCWINEWKDYFQAQPSSYTCVLLRLRRRTTRSFLIHFLLTLHVNVVESSNIGHVPYMGVGGGACEPLWKSLLKRGLNCVGNVSIFFRVPM